MHGKSHVVYRLPVHLPEEQSVFFDANNLDNDALTHIVSENEGKDSMLTGWFKLNERDFNAHDLLYAEIGKEYVWSKAKRQWDKRQRGADKIISRIYTISPKDEELFYLRLLLLHVRGAKSFEDMRTVPDDNGIPVVYSTFKEAARARHLTRDDTEFDQALTEAAIYRMPRQLRQLFYNLCQAGMVDDYLKLFNAHKKSMYEDFQYAHPDGNEELWTNYLLQDLNKKFGYIHSRNDNYGLPMPNKSLLQNTEIYDNMSKYNFSRLTVDQHKEKGEQMREQLNLCQIGVIKTILTSVENEDDMEKFKKRNVFFVEGEGGTGKSFTINVIKLKFTF